MQVTESTDHRDRIDTVLSSHKVTVKEEDWGQGLGASSKTSYCPLVCNPSSLPCISYSQGSRMLAAGAGSSTFRFRERGEIVVQRA